MNAGVLMSRVLWEQLQEHMAALAQWHRLDNDNNAADRQDEGLPGAQQELSSVACAGAGQQAAGDAGYDVQGSDHWPAWSMTCSQIGCMQVCQLAGR